MKTWTTKLGGAEFRVQRLCEGPPELADRLTLDNPQAVVDYLRPKLAASLCYRPDVENLLVVQLNTRKRPIGWEVASNGLLDSCLADVRIIFRSAIVMNAAAIVLAHNHPSGDPSPSEADKQITRNMIRAGQLLKIELCDHIVLGAAAPPERLLDWVSLREQGCFAY